LRLWQNEIPRLADFLDEFSVATLFQLH
jgi:hypothetical protein